MHGKNSFLRKNEIHDRENRFLDLTSVASTADDDFSCCVVNDDETLRIQGWVVRLEMRCMEDREFRSV